mmetsp:Transcript_21860/g.54956  ORF Transcript_21860/g.54956 Transcript_21860/m.54956 type:complete len:252 (+) Transcript_21860:503-1258(+)
MRAAQRTHPDGVGHVIHACANGVWLQGNQQVELRSRHVLQVLRRLLVGLCAREVALLGLLATERLARTAKRHQIGIGAWPQIQEVVAGNKSVDPIGICILEHVCAPRLQLGHARVVAQQELQVDVALPQLGRVLCREVGNHRLVQRAQIVVVIHVAQEPHVLPHKLGHADEFLDAAIVDGARHLHLLVDNKLELSCSNVHLPRTHGVLARLHKAAPCRLLPLHAAQKEDVLHKHQGRGLRLPQPVVHGLCL